MHGLLSNNTTTYILGDFNGRHSSFVNRENNVVSKSLVNLINQGKRLHLGPHSPTYIGHNSATTPDKTFSNKHHYLNYITEPGKLTISDPLPVIFNLSTTPFIYRLIKLLQ